MDEAPTSEPDDAGAEHQVPDDLLELHQVIEYAAAAALPDPEPLA